MDQDRYYEDEEQEIREEEAEQPAEEVDDMKFFIGLLKHLRLALNSGTSVPLTGKKLIDIDKCLMIVDDMQSNLPDAVQYGMKMYAERERLMKKAEKDAYAVASGAEMRANAALEKAKQDAQRIISDAESEANAILSDAQERADHLVDENEIVRRAREEARIIKNDVRVEASELRLKANHDAYQLLSSVEDELVEACKAVRRRRAELGDEAE